MTASQPSRRQVASVGRTARRAAAALPAIHDEQVLMRELFWQCQPRPPVHRAGPLAWNPLPGWLNLTSSDPHIPDDTSDEDGR